MSRCDSSLHCHVRIWQNRTVRFALIPTHTSNTILKLCSYLFLVERVHIVRAPFAHRFRDPVWVFGVLITVGGLGSIVGVEYIAPRSSISPGDGQCQMGIVPKTAIAIMAFDMGIGAILTGIFVWIMRSSFWPVGSMAMQPTSASDHDRRSGQKRWSRRLTRCSSRSGLGEERKKKARSEKTSREQLKGMLWRNIIGSTIALAATVANNLIFLVWKHAGRSYVCFLACMIDGTFDDGRHQWSLFRKKCS